MSVVLDYSTMLGKRSFLETLRLAGKTSLSEQPCFESSLTFDEACERAKFGFIPKSFIFIGCRDIVEMAVARSVRYLDRAGGCLERDDLYNQAYLMVLEQFERWNPCLTIFRKYLHSTLAFRLRKYIDSMKYHGKGGHLQEVAVKPSEFTGDFEEDSESPATISLEDREKFSTHEDVLSNIFVNDLLEKLPKRNRFIMRAYIYEDQTFEQIGAQLGITRTVVGDYVKRSIKWLREYLEDPNIPPMITALSKEDKVVSLKSVQEMTRFFAEHSCTEDAAYSAGFPRRVWRKTATLLREAGYLKTKAVHGGGRASYLTALLDDCLEYIQGAFSGEGVTSTDIA